MRRSTSRRPLVRRTPRGTSAPAARKRSARIQAGPHGWQSPTCTARIACQHSRVQYVGASHNNMSRPTSSRCKVEGVGPVREKQGSDGGVSPVLARTWQGRAHLLRDVATHWAAHDGWRYWIDPRHAHALTSASSVWHRHILQRTAAVNRWRAAWCRHGITHGMVRYASRVSPAFADQILRRWLLPCTFDLQAGKGAH